MPDPVDITRRLPGRPQTGTTTTFDPDELGPSARAMYGVPAATQQPSTKAGGNEDVRVTGADRD